MPYIKEEFRADYDKLIDTLVDRLMCAKYHEGKDAVKGHHNYVMYRLAKNLAERLGVRYHTLQDIMGTFDCCKLEFYRRVIGPYEDKAIEKNGDVE